MTRVDGARLGSWIVLALTAACSSSGGTASGGHGGTVGHGGAGVTSSTASSSSSVATVGAGGFGNFGGFGGTGGAVASSCDPPPDPSTVWAQKALSYPGYTDVTLCPYVGDVLLIVNTAAV